MKHLLNGKRCYRSLKDCVSHQRRCLQSATPSYRISQSKHLTSGDSCPELSPNTLRLYSMKWCPFAQRTRLAIAHKQVRHEEVNINLSDKPNWLMEKNPDGTVPLLEIVSGSAMHRVIGSLECCHWLEKSYPKAPLLFSDDANALISSHFKPFEAGRVMNAYLYERADSSQVTNSLKAVEETWNPQPFLAGNQPTMADFLAWPMFERILAKGYVIDSASMPKLFNWVEHMNHLPAVVDVRNCSQGYHKYWSSQRDGAPEYDTPS